MWRTFGLIVGPVAACLSLYRVYSDWPRWLRGAVYAGILIFYLLGVASILPQYYELRSAGLFIRRGWRTMLIPYTSLRTYRPAEYLPATLATDGLRITTTEGRAVLVAPLDRERFLEELTRCAPLLERASPAHAIVPR